MSGEVAIECKTRVFNLNQIRLPDPDPAMPADDVLAFYSKTYRILAHSTVGAPHAVGDELHYDIETPSGKTKG